MRNSGSILTILRDWKRVRRLEGISGRLELEEAWSFIGIELHFLEAASQT